MIIERTARQIEPDGSIGPPRTLAAYRETPAWVLLGDPGAGKTTAFETEACGDPERVHLVSARDFLTFEPKNRPEWRGRTLLIDGLDETRAGSANARTPFDVVRARLDELGRPRFRLSCREADWLGINDRERLKAVCPTGEVIVLRLEPLTRDEARRLVEGRLSKSGAAGFFGAVSDRGLDALLTNPQTLDLLTRVFCQSGEVPESRLDTFTQASGLLAREANSDHRLSTGEVPEESILDAAGRLSAVQLLSGAAGHRLSDGARSDGYMPISVHDRVFHDDIVAALRTRLFTAGAEGCFRPAHAHLAAFLAARHLAARAVRKVSAGRVLALLAGADGAPRTPLRGLAAWLAATSPDLRLPLIERDPVAVLMFGDVRAFAPEEKEHLLDAIGHEPFRLYESPWPASAVEGLAGPDMANASLKRLRGADRSDANQSVVEVVAKALARSPTTASQSDALLSVAEDATYRAPVRKQALDAWIRSIGGRSDRTDRLRRVLDAIHEGRMKDADRALRGALLAALYPDDLSPSEVWDYFDPPSGQIFNEFYLFWRRLGETCPVDHLPGHLDRLSGSGSPISTGGHRLFLFDMPLHLLTRGLERYGAEVETCRLFRWLQVGKEAPGKLTPLGVESREEVRTVRRWLEARPDVQKALIRFALRADQVSAPEGAGYLLDEVLYWSRLPDDIGQWHLSEAVATRDARLMEMHVREFVRALPDQSVSMDRSLARARRRLEVRPSAITVLDRNLRTPLSDDYLENRIRWQHLSTRHERVDRALVSDLRSHMGELLQNEAPPAILDRVARWWHAGEGSLVEALGGDRDLARAALDGVRGAVEREDLPSAEHLVRLRRRRRVSLFVWPVLLGLGDRRARDAMVLRDEILRSALTCRLLSPGLAQTTEWYRQCVRDRPDLVAEVLRLTGRALLRTGETCIPDFRSLAHDDEHAVVARHTAISLLDAFPARPGRNQLDLLDPLLLASLRYADTASGRTELSALIETKANQKSATATVRVLWLTAGIVLDAAKFLPLLSSALGTTEVRVRRLGLFFEPMGAGRLRWMHEMLSVETIAFLIGTLGRIQRPDVPDGRVRSDAGIPWLVSRLIENLASIPERRATEAFRDLLSENGLAAWRATLEGALGAQRVVRRDARYEPPTPRTVLAVLDDGPPASAGDLRELVVDRLERIAGEIRATNANLWRQFWNEDRERPEGSKHENACRDALLALLRVRLPDGCDAQPEGQYAGNRRADLRVSYGEWNVPVEIKKNRHSDLWRAVRNQLLPRYANDPATEGLGIYLVLWFGAWRTAVAENGRPGTPDALREHLLAELTPEERRRAAVVVMDVTPPHAAADDRRGTSPGSETGEPQEPPSPRAAPRHRPGLPNAPAAGRRRVG